MLALVVALIPSPSLDRLLGYFLQKNAALCQKKSQRDSCTMQSSKAISFLPFVSPIRLIMSISLSSSRWILSEEAIPLVQFLNNKQTKLEPKGKLFYSPVQLTF